MPGNSQISSQRYTPIVDYAIIGDCHTAALVSRSASIDWCCLPRFDGGTIFGRLLDWERGGFCLVEPAEDNYTSTRNYVENTLVLATTFRAPGGEARLLDCFTMWEDGEDLFLAAEASGSFGQVGQTLEFATSGRQGGLQQARPYLSDLRPGTEQQRGLGLGGYLGQAEEAGSARYPLRQLLRVVEGVRGTIEMRAFIQPRFDYGSLKPWLQRYGPNVFSAVGGNDALVIAGDAPLEMCEDAFAASFSVRAGERVRFSFIYRSPAELDSQSPPPYDPDELDLRLDATIVWWRKWASKVKVQGPYAPEVARSALVLKALVNAPTGAVVAAPTTSLPESIGHGRNWDYRYSWVRDSQFTVRSLTKLGCNEEAEGFRRFIERSAAGSADSLQIMYGAGGERRLTEVKLDLDGYQSSRPVRIGNAASAQRQLDVFGYLLDLSWRWHLRGESPEDDYWRFLLSLVDKAISWWQEPDHGIWEMRGKPQHFVHSKVMCWTAVDRGIKLARGCLRQAPVDEWELAEKTIRETIERDGYDHDRGVFVQAFGTSELDAALLLLPAFDFLEYNDERMLRTTDAIREELDDNGLLRRYISDDGLEGREGVFVPCTFWLAECLAQQGRTKDARDVFGRAVATANDLGLFSEEFDPSSRILLGNFPQGLTHLSHIAAAVALIDALRADGGE